MNTFPWNGPKQSACIRFHRPFSTFHGVILAWAMFLSIVYIFFQFLCPYLANTRMILLYFLFYLDRNDMIIILLKLLFSFSLELLLYTQTLLDLFPDLTRFFCYSMAPFFIYFTCLSLFCMFRHFFQFRIILCFCCRFRIIYGPFFYFFSEVNVWTLIVVFCFWFYHIYWGSWDIIRYYVLFPMIYWIS